MVEVLNQSVRADSNHRNRIRGMFLGIAIGDALGMSVESWPAAKISETYGRITDYLVPTEHKYFKNEESGTYTDDTQLSIAVAKGMIENPLDMDAQAKYHIEALKETTKGWGGSTRNSVRRVANGAHWSESAEPPTEQGRGAGGGNGVPMKIAPVGAYLWVNKHNASVINDSIEFIANLSQMTHGTSISVSAGLAQAFAVFQCLLCNQGKFNSLSFSKTVCMASEVGKNYLPETINDDLTERLAKVYSNIDEYNDAKIVEEFIGSCYCYNSVPFTHAFFYKNPTSIESMYDCISAGGDTDSNGSMLGAMLGALNGEEIFPEHLVSGLKDSQFMLDLADQFCDKFEIK